MDLLPIVCRADLAAIKPKSTKIRFPCDGCGKLLNTRVDLCLKRDRSLCFSCLNRSRPRSIAEKIGRSLAAHKATDAGKVAHALSSKKTGETLRSLYGSGALKPVHCDPVLAAARSRAAWSDPVKRQRMLDGHKRIRTASWCQVMREKQLSVWSDLALRQSQSDKLVALWSEREFREAHSAVYQTDEYREKQRRASALRWEDPVFRERMIRAAKERWQNPEFRARMAAAMSVWTEKVSMLSRIASEHLTALGVEHTLEHLVGPYRFDVFIPSHNILLELNGSYWHSLPRAVRNDKSKSTYVERYHPQMRLVTIWEKDFKIQNLVRQTLERILGITTVTPVEVAKSDLSVRIGKRDDVALLYASYHYRSTARGNLHMVLEAKGEAGPKVIGACSFGPFQRNEQRLKYGADAVELTRFCRHDGYAAHNLASWFLSRCLRLLPGSVSSVVTYADATQGHSGTLYKACGFTKSHTVNPDYHYLDRDGWCLHKKTVWNRATVRGLTESAYASELRLTKQYGLEKTCFIKAIS